MAISAANSRRQISRKTLARAFARVQTADSSIPCPSPLSGFNVRLTCRRDTPVFSAIPFAEQAVVAFRELFDDLSSFVGFAPGNARDVDVGNPGRQGVGANEDRWVILGIISRHSGP